jgi:hypothetical protein
MSPSATPLRIIAFAFLPLLTAAWTWETLPPDFQRAVVRSEQVLRDHGLDPEAYRPGQLRRIEDHRKIEDNPWTVFWTAKLPQQTPHRVRIDVFSDGRVTFDPNL